MTWNIIPLILKSLGCTISGIFMFSPFRIVMSAFSHQFQPCLQVRPCVTPDQIGLRDPRRHAFTLGKTAARRLLSLAMMARADVLFLLNNLNNCTTFFLFIISQILSGLQVLVNSIFLSFLPFIFSMFGFSIFNLCIFKSHKTEVF